MKPSIFRILSVLLCGFMMFPSCDFLRKVASRPSGRQVQEAFAERQKETLESMVRAEIQAAIADSLALQDSLDREEQRKKDELATSEALAAARLADMGVHISSAVSRESFPDNAFDAKYGVVIGIFRYPPYAKALYDKAKKAGADAFTINCQDKLTAVLAGKSDSLEEICDIVDKYKGKDFFPSDVWIVSNSNE